MTFLERRAMLTRLVSQRQSEVEEMEKQIQQAKTKSGTQRPATAPTGRRPGRRRLGQG